MTGLKPVAGAELQSSEGLAAVKIEEIQWKEESAAPEGQLSNSSRQGLQAIGRMLK